MSRLRRRKADGEPRPWSRAEESAFLSLLKAGKDSIADLQANFPSRSEASLISKKRRVRIKYDLFGAGYRDQKAEFTEEVCEAVRPRIVFEAYAGAGHQTSVWLRSVRQVFACDKSPRMVRLLKSRLGGLGFRKSVRRLEGWMAFTDEGNREVHVFAGDAVDAAAHLRTHRVSVDLMDLDTCGSTLPTLPMFLQLVRPRFLTITHGEFHSHRFGREDVLRRVFLHRDITDAHIPKDVDGLAEELDMAVKAGAIRCHNETEDSWWVELEKEVWLGRRDEARMIRRLYRIRRPRATADCLNELAGL